MQFLEEHTSVRGSRVARNRSEIETGHAPCIPLIPRASAGRYRMTGVLLRSHIYSDHVHSLRIPHTKDPNNLFFQYVF